MTVTEQLARATKDCPVCFRSLCRCTFEERHPWMLMSEVSTKPVARFSNQRCAEDSVRIRSARPVRLIAGRLVQMDGPVVQHWVEWDPAVKVQVGL
jgi:hypothetical protein